MMSPQGHANIVSASTHSPYWKAVRKGIAVAFRANNMKCAALLTADTSALYCVRHHSFLDLAQQLKTLCINPRFLRRAGFPRVVEAGRQLVDTLRVVSAGGKVVDMNDALLRESIDVIGVQHAGRGLVQEQRTLAKYPSVSGR